MTNNLYGYRALLDDAEMQHKLCRGWLLEKMGESPEKTQTKGDLRIEAIGRFKISKSAFERAWTSVMEERNRRWSRQILRTPN
jgi:hypothetical protein